jgi:hypothetical protein
MLRATRVKELVTVLLLSVLNMLAVTGGRERSEREWRALLDAAGFILTRVCPVGGDTLMGFSKRSQLRDEPKLFRTLDSFVWDDIHTALFPPRTEVRMCTNPKIAKR